MSEMVERVARAIHDASHKGLDFEWPREMRLAQARAAIEAMRAPTDEMVSAALDQSDAYDGEYISPENAWEAMITAALGEGE